MTLQRFFVLNLISLIIVIIKNVLLKWVAISLFAMLMFPARLHSFNGFITVVNSGAKFSKAANELECH